MEMKTYFMVLSRLLLRSIERLSLKAVTIFGKEERRKTLTEKYTS